MLPRCCWLALVSGLILTLSWFAHGEPAKQAPVRVDQQGDPLPMGALARLGTLRFRHGGRIQAGVFAADGKTLTTYGEDEVIRTWAVPTGRLMAELPRLGTRVESVAAAAFSANGKLLAIAGRWESDWLVLLCDVQSGRELRRFSFKGFDHWRQVVALSSDGKFLAAVNDLGSFKIWDTAAGKQLHTIDWPCGMVTGLTFSPDGSTLAGRGSFDSLAWWDVRSGRQLRYMRLRSPTDIGDDEVRRAYHFGIEGRSPLVFLPDGKTLAAVKRPGAVHLWDVQTGKECACLCQDSEKEALLLKEICGVAAFRRWDDPCGKHLCRRGFPLGCPNRAQAFPVQTAAGIECLEQPGNAVLPGWPKARYLGRSTGRPALGHADRQGANGSPGESRPADCPCFFSRRPAPGCRRCGPARWRVGSADRQGLGWTDRVQAQGDFLRGMLCGCFLSRRQSPGLRRLRLLHRSFICAPRSETPAWHPAG